MLAILKLILLSAIFDFSGNRPRKYIKRDDTSIWENFGLNSIRLEVWFRWVSLLYRVNVIFIDSSLGFFVFCCSLDPCDNFATDDTWS